MSDIVSRLKDISQNDDHSRGCQGRQYECTCGYDARTLATADDAVAEIERLRTELQEARDKGLEEAACWHDDKAAQHIAFSHDAPAMYTPHHEMLVRQHRGYAAAIRQLKGEQG